MDVNDDASVVDCDGASEPACRDNELGYMFYQNMGGTFSNDLTGDQTVDDVLLTAVQPAYWSGTEFAPDPTDAWVFVFADGHQIGVNKGRSLSSFAGWAVRAGDVGAVPVPAAVWLFGSGLIGLIGVARRSRRYK